MAELQPSSSRPEGQFINSHGRLTPEGAALVDARLAELCGHKIPWPDVVETLNREFGLSFTPVSYRDRAKRLGIARTTCDRAEIVRRAIAARDDLHDAKHPRWNGQPPEIVIANPKYEEESGIIKEFVICRICGKQLNSINGHLYENPPGKTLTHPGIDLAEYKRLFPGAPIYSDALKARNLEHALADYKDDERRLEIRTRANARNRRVAGQAKQAEAALAERTEAQQRVKELTAELSEARAVVKAERAKAKADKAQASPLAETVRRKLAEPDKHPWMSPNEAAVAFGIHRATFFRNLPTYTRLRKNAKGWYSTTSLISQLNAPHQK